MNNVRAHLALGVLHQFLDLLHEGVDEPTAPGVLEWVPASITQADIALHGLPVRARELRG